MRYVIQIEGREFDTGCRTKVEAVEWVRQHVQKSANLGYDLEPEWGERFWLDCRAKATAIQLVCESYLVKIKESKSLTVDPLS